MVIVLIKITLQGETFNANMNWYPSFFLKK